MPEQDNENETLRKALRDIIFDLHNCQYGGDMPRCEHIGDALVIARTALGLRTGREQEAEGV